MGPWITSEEGWSPERPAHLGGGCVAQAPLGGSCVHSGVQIHFWVCPVCQLHASLQGWEYSGSDEQSRALAPRVALGG